MNFIAQFLSFGLRGLLPVWPQAIRVATRSPCTIRNNDLCRCKLTRLFARELGRHRA